MTTEILADRRLLVVEDEVVVVMVVEDVLGDVVCEVVAANDKASALSLIKKEEFDAVILDVELGGFRDVGTRTREAPTPSKNGAVSGRPRGRAINLRAKRAGHAEVFSEPDIADFWRGRLSRPQHELTRH